MEFWVEDTGPGIPEEKQASVLFTVPLMKASDKR